METGSVYVFGLDGATFELMNPMLKQGELPNIAKLMQNGCYGELLSSNPDLSPPAWTSFMTGKHPGKHGVMDFFGHKSSSYELEFINATYRRARSIWNMLSQAQRTVCVVNVPFTYPPESVNGVMISGMDTPGAESDFMYPPSLKEELEKNVGPYLLEQAERDVRDDRMAEYAENVSRTTQNRFDAAKFLLGKDSWDFFMIVFEATDRVQHTMWKYFDDNHPDYTDENNQKFGSLLAETYRDLDSKIGELVDMVPENATVVLMSDHGFGPLHKGFRLESWLAQNDYLKESKRANLSLFSMGKQKLKNMLPPSIQGYLRKKLPFEVLKTRLLSLDHVDLSESKVFTVGGHGHLVINLRGREPMGIVEPGIEYERLCQDIIERLKLLKDPDTGECIVDDAQMRDDVYDEYQDNTPDIIIKWANGYYNFGERDMQLLDLEAGAGDLFTKHRWSGNHRPEGILIMHGKNVAPIGAYTGARIIDLAPTILALLGLPIPNDMDGAVLTGLLARDFLNQREIEYCDPAKENTWDVLGYSESDQKKVSERLKDLGYLE